MKGIMVMLNYRSLCVWGVFMCSVVNSFLVLCIYILKENLKDTVYEHNLWSTVEMGSSLRCHKSREVYNMITEHLAFRAQAYRTMCCLRQSEPGFYCAKRKTIVPGWIRQWI